MPEEGMTVTFDRARRSAARISASSVAIIRWCVPPWDLLLGAEAGNASFGMWKGAGGEAILLEIHAVVECVAPVALHADRFSPGDADPGGGGSCAGDHTENEVLLAARFEKGDIFRLLDRGVVKKKLIPRCWTKRKRWLASG